MSTNHHQELKYLPFVISREEPLAERNKQKNLDKKMIVGKLISF